MTSHQTIFSRPRGIQNTIKKTSIYAFIVGGKIYEKVLADGEVEVDAHAGVAFNET